GVIAIGRIGDHSYGTIQSLDGIEWSTPILNTPVAANDDFLHGHGLIPIGHRFIAWGGNLANYSDDFGETWSTPVTIAPGVWGGPRSTELVNTESILIPLVGPPYFAVSYRSEEHTSELQSRE